MFYSDSGSTLKTSTDLNDVSYNRESRLHDHLAQITMDALSAHIAILDQNGQIMVVNRAWHDFAVGNGGDPLKLSQGVNYLDACKKSAEAGVENMRDFVNQVDRIINDEIEDFSLEYPCHSPTQQRWFVAKVTRFLHDDELYVVVAHENVTPVKLVEEAERRQRVFAEALLDISTMLNSTLDYEAVLQRILDNLARVIPYDYANIMIISDQTYHVVGADVTSRIVSGLRSPEDLHALIEANQSAIIYYDDPTTEYTYIGIPIFSNETVIGIINLEQYEPPPIVDGHLEHLYTFANHAAIAIKNAQLYQQAQLAAALEERQRLARDLHDSVTQTLFSADLIAQTLPRLWQRNTNKAANITGELHELTAGALAEMRTLLMELRPSALQEATLGELITQLTSGFSGRTRVPISVSIDNLPKLPYEAKIVFYRTTQETLNNIHHHACANHVTVDVTFVNNKLGLLICDDGCGFNTTDINHDHHGLNIMLERAQSIDAELQIISAPDEGTTVSLHWKYS